MEITTKATRLNKKWWGCRILVDGEPLLEVRVDNKEDIAPAFRDMMRTMDKLGFIDERLMAARKRMNKEGYKHFKFVWYK